MASSREQVVEATRVLWCVLPERMPHECNTDRLIRGLVAAIESGRWESGSTVFAGLRTELIKHDAEGGPSVADCRALLVLGERIAKLAHNELDLPMPFDSDVGLGLPFVVAWVIERLGASVLTDDEIRWARDLQPLPEVRGGCQLRVRRDPSTTNPDAPVRASELFAEIICGYCGDDGDLSADRPETIARRGRYGREDSERALRAHVAEFHGLPVPLTSS